MLDCKIAHLLAYLMKNTGPKSFSHMFNGFNVAKQPPTFSNNINIDAHTLLTHHTQFVRGTTLHDIKQTVTEIRIVKSAYSALCLSSATQAQQFVLLVSPLTKIHAVLQT